LIVQVRVHSQYKSNHGSYHVLCGILVWQNKRR